MDEASEARRRRSLLLRNKRARYEKGECSTSATATFMEPIVHIERGKSVEPHDVGYPEYRCRHCGSYYWYFERCKKSSKSNNLRYSLCCRDGRVSLPVVKDPPDVLDKLLDSSGGVQSTHFRDKIRMYNSMFAFTSLGVKVDEKINDGHGPYVFKVSGETCHRIGSILPIHGSKPVFAQLYMYDTANEVVNRINAFADSYSFDNAPRNEIVEQLIDMLNENNVIVQAFRSYQERFSNCDVVNLNLRIIGVRNHDLPQYAPPMASEIVGLVVGDLSEEERQRDIIVEHSSNGLQRIKFQHPCYMSMQYPLLFPFGEDGFHSHIKYAIADASENKIKRKCVTMNEYYIYRLHQRDKDAYTIFHSGRLFQQYIIDAYLSVEQKKLSYFQQNHASLRCDKYKNIRTAVIDGDMLGKNIGKRVILPASHIGSPRYMYQNYQDAIAICKDVGLPDLFITFTCNPQWPEIARMPPPLQRSEDRPDIVIRIFRMKLDELFF